MILTEKERDLLAAQRHEREIMRVVEQRLAASLVATHRPTAQELVDPDFPTPLCAECDQDYPCPEIRWADLRRRGGPVRLHAYHGNGHQPEREGEQ